MQFVLVIQECSAVLNSLDMTEFTSTESSATAKLSNRLFARTTARLFDDVARYVFLSSACCVSNESS